ncbi:MAG: archease [Dehalococcoidia bacterium]
MEADGPPPYEVIEHTADVGIVVHGATLADLFSNAALGMFALMADLAGVEERSERSVELEGSDWGGLLVKWLSELLFFLDAEELLLSRFQIDRLEPFDSAQGRLYRLKARAYGEPIDRGRHQLRFGVKAVTRHMLEVRQEDGRWRAQVLFDI